MSVCHDSVQDSWHAPMPPENRYCGRRSALGAMLYNQFAPIMSATVCNILQECAQLAACTLGSLRTLEFEDDRRS
ncbi:hypothetical protein KIN20_036122 [Parelaphostrongylus tenuis]|uniref:Uncharacterized protein n=1 Tax=Parelaphostrongylus tenuis TaxID=148309 RepID=A0AAD5RCS4_PARTN|nr:hypothetical protein KIN20_036122 [Parelaphostrongylus tenuis]